MPIDHILPILIAERDKLSRAIEALQGPAKRPGRKPPSVETAAAAPASPKKRRLSAGARRKIAAAQKKRWAAIKAAK
jgi:hypothetical protein